MTARSEIAISGAGAVSPAGWSASELFDAVQNGTTIPVESVQREGTNKSVSLKRVPPLTSRKPLRHPRLRRVSPVAKYSVDAALQALGADRCEAAREGKLRIGVIQNAVNGCVNFTRKFYSELLQDPGLASPILFPETVFNSPASHISAVINSHEMNYTLIGDSTQFLTGLGIAANWILQDLVDGCVVVGAEETDWLSYEAVQLFEPDIPIGEGAGALYLEPASSDSPVHLEQITTAFSYGANQSRAEAVAKMQKAIGSPEGPGTLCSESMTQDILGFGMGAATAWQCVYAYEVASASPSQHVVIEGVGDSQQTIGAIFRNRNS